MRQKVDGVSTSALYLALQADLAPYCSSKDELLDVNVSPQVFASRAMLGSFYKKYVEATSKNADALALEKFLQVNDACGTWELSLSGSWEEELVGELKSSLNNFFYPGGQPLLLSLDDFLRHGKVGPGASVGARGFDFYTKLFSSPLSMTSASLYKAYKGYIWNFPEWSQADIVREAEFGGPVVVSGNRLSFVPKSVDISRTISVEPLLNMFYQLGVKEILERRLNAAFGIDLAGQQRKNRELARLGSLSDGDDSFVTIDLSSASDSMSLKMIRSVFPPNVVGWFELLRSPKCTLPNGEQVVLNMVSTMGNGFTFPLQTILFTCVVIAAYRMSNRPIRFPYGNNLGNLGVNGDDIICEKQVSRLVIRLLEILGFQVNRDKTFVEGPFRESCGHDYYRGQLVRGVYVKTLSDPASRYALINALNLWSARVGISLPTTVGYLLSTVRFLPVPLWENVDAGIRVPFHYARSITGRSKRYQSILYECLVPLRTVIRISDDRLHVPRGSKFRIYNPPGLLMAVLNGSIRSCSIGVRHDTSRYKTKRRIAPNWDYSETSSEVASEERTEAWESFAVQNLGLE